MSSSQKLEFEDEDGRQKRIAALLAKTDSSIERATSCPNRAIRNPDQLPPLPSTSTNELLSRIKNFLPQLEAANRDMQQILDEDPKSLDIETLNEDDEKYIEMDLGLGVFKQKQADATTSSSDDSDETDSDEGSDEEDSGSESPAKTKGKRSKEERKIKPLPTRKDKAPLIVEMG